ncbi:helix-turn-helix domain-containing protein [Dysgonomonas sp. Marseille-P4361]|uniref:helix-turn-helix domain-containing protein n=1 Tax=Dysgonomonas sp. Marseille-P4361 TaxID=2161820 RepID=UPI000D554CE4
MEYLTTKEVCKRLKITKRTLYTWVNNGKIKRYKAGNRSLYRVEDVNSLIQPA